MSDIKYVRQLFIDRGAHAGLNIDVEIIGMASNSMVRVRPVAGQGVIEVHSSKLRNTIRGK